MTVHNGSVRLCATDHGARRAGDPTIVLMHGLGGSQRSMARVAARLADWRVITMDLRGHGRSTSAPWTYADVVADLDAVVTHFDLHRPYVGGHSLGGMLALQYGLAGRPVSGVINVDGWGPGVADRYVGEDPRTVNAQLDRVAAGQLSSRTARVLTALTRQARQGTTRQVLGLLDRADVVAWHAAVPCRSLAFNAIAPLGKTATRVVGAEMARLHAAHRAGLRRDLAAQAKAHPQLRVVEVEATHRLIATHADLVAGAINAFGERAVGQA